MRQSFIFILAGLLSLTACDNAKKLTKKSVLLNTVSVTPNNPYNIIRTSATRLWQIDTTWLELSFNYPEKLAYGRAVLQLHPYFYSQDSLVLDAKSMKIDSVHSISSNGQSPLKYRYQGDSLTIQLPAAFASSDVLKLGVVYTAIPYAASAGGSAAITEDRGLYFINTDGKIPGKPLQIWSQGESESNSHWFPTIDKPNSRSSFQISLTVPDSFKTLSNGLKIGSVANGAMRTDTWQTKLPIQVYAAMIAIGKFNKVEDSSWRGKEVSYYTEPAFAPYAKLIFQHTPEMIEYFSTVTGVPFPWDKYSQVIVRDYVSGAMENTSASLFGEFVNQNARQHADNNYEDVVSHELFHQWFGDYVTFESWSHLTLSESFANYGEYLWRKHYYGAESADELHYNDLAKYILAADQNDAPLLRYHYSEREDMFDRISYQKGGAILHYLHQLIGDKAFSAAMKNYLTQNALHSAEVPNWRMAIEQATGQDWKWFFDQWYEQGGHPYLDVRYKYDDDSQKLYVTVKQIQKDSNRFFYLPLKAGLLYEDPINDSEVDWLVAGKKEQVYAYAYKNGQKPIFNPDATHVLPGKIDDYKTADGWLLQYKNSGGDFISRYKAVARAYNTFGDSSAKVLFRLAMHDSNATVRWLVVEYLGRESKPAVVKEWKDDMLRLAKNDSAPKVKATAIEALGKWSATEAGDVAETAINDSSYMVAGSALATLFTVDSVKAYNLAKNLWYKDPRSSLQSEIWATVARAGDDSDFALFSEQADRLSGRENFAFSTNLPILMHRVSATSTYEQGLKTLKTVIERENIENFREHLSNAIFSEVAYYKSRSGDEAKARLALAQQYANALIGEEPDKDMKERLKTKLINAEK